MASDYKEAIRRQNALAQARDLARSGEHENWASIETAMMARDGYPLLRRWFEDGGFRAQLNKLCSLARSGLTAPRGPRGGRRARGGTL